MMLVHEAGHVVGALVTGGTVRNVVWHPLVISRTDVKPNPSPLVVVIAGPVVGSLLPLAGYLAMRFLSLRSSQLAGFFAGFCLIANGCYISIGSFQSVGDAGDMLELGTPQWLMVLVGLMAAAGGLAIWNQISPRLGFGRAPEQIPPRDVLISVLIALLLCIAGFAFGNRG